MHEMCHAASKLGSSPNNPFMVDKRNEVRIVAYLPQEQLGYVMKPIMH